MATPTTDVHNESLPTTSYISADTDSECQSSSACTPPETPVAPLRLSTANRSLLVRVLNRNLAQQQQDTGLQSLSSDPLLNALPAGSPLSYPNSATARMVAEQAWLASDSHTPYRPDSCEDRSPVTPASMLLSSPDSPTTVLLRAAANATAPPPPTPAASSEPCTPCEPLEAIPRAASAGNVAAPQTCASDEQQLRPCLVMPNKCGLENIS